MRNTAQIQYFVIVVNSRLFSLMDFDDEMIKSVCLKHLFPGVFFFSEACERQQDVTTVCPNEDQDFKVKIEDLITSSCTDYQVQTVLGCGAYGLVTQCLKMSTRETVALKIFTKKQSTNDAQEEVQQVTSRHL